MHMFEWPRLGLWKKRICENLCWFCFEKFGNFVVQNLDYCSHCLFVASSKVLVLLRLTYIIHIVFQIYPKSIPCKSCRWTQEERKLRRFSRRFWVSWKIQTWPGVSGLLRYKYPFHRGQLLFTPFTVWQQPLSPPVASPFLPLLALRRFSFSTVQISCE
jgi:hypothetical protein